MKPFLWLVLALLVSLIIVKIREFILKPESAIKAVFSQTKYQHLIPIVIAQAKHETANFKSDIFKRLNNMFGMTNAKKRPQLGTFNLSGFRQYSTKYESALDLLHWLHYNDFPAVINSPTYYVKKLKDLKYFEDSEENYLNGLKSWL